MEIKVYTDIKQMAGIGEEWLIDSQENVRAVFIDGNLRCEIIPLFEGQENTAIAC